MSEQVVVRRVIAAPCERVFAAWTTPALLLAWWGPAGVTCTAAEIDLRVGGAYRLGNQLPDGRIVWISGTFTIVDPPHELVYSWQIGDEPASRVAVRFMAIAPNSCEVTIVHDRVASIEARDDHERGWIGCLDKLERVLAT